MLWLLVYFAFYSFFYNELLSSVNLFLRNQEGTIVFIQFILLLLVHQLCLQLITIVHTFLKMELSFS